jgi:hypothetical protein
MITMHVNRKQFPLPDGLFILPEETVDQHRDVHRVAMSSTTDGDVVRKVYRHIQHMKVPIAKIVFSSPSHIVEYENVIPSFEHENDHVFVELEVARKGGCTVRRV